MKHRKEKHIVQEIRRNHEITVWPAYRCQSRKYGDEYEIPAVRSLLGLQAGSRLGQSPSRRRNKRWIPLGGQVAEGFQIIFMRARALDLFYAYLLTVLLP